MSAVLNRLDLRGVTGDLRAVLPRPSVGGDEPVAVVREILEGVRTGGDAALRDFAARFDGTTSDEVRVPTAALDEALAAADPGFVAALRTASENIRAFHETQRRPDHETAAAGLRVESRTIPVERAGCYVPGGRGAYPSTVLMTAVPAKVAGVEQVVLCVPPDRTTGAVHPAVLAAAALAGVDEVYAVGGAHAIAALAYGTETIRPVDVIVGPGNVYVALAKREVAAAGMVGIPSAFAGPSEIVVIADATVPPAFAAVDVIVQAEHGPDGLAWLVTWEEVVADAVDAEIARMVAASPRRADIESTFADGGYAVLVDGPEHAVAVANAIAPEHLQLMCADPDGLVPLVRHAGEVFCGPLAPASLGDYAAGPSHVLPTFGSARFGSALPVDDFTKQVHVVRVEREGFERLAPVVATIADVEGFAAHADSVRLRLAALADGDTAL